MSDDPRFVVRRATPGDAAIVARHRAEMFRDMGVLRDDVYPPLMEATTRYAARAIADEEYLAWLAAPVSEPETIIGGAGVQLRPMMPRPDYYTGEVNGNPQALVMNVFTERDWRRRGVAQLLMRHVLDWARESRITNVVLHASAEGRPLYERIGFLPTNEMRYDRRKDPAAR